MKESNYKLAYDHEWEKLKKKDPILVEKYLDVKWDKDSQTFEVPYCNRSYTVDWKGERIYDAENNQISNILQAILIMNYLAHSRQQIKMDYEYVSLKELPYGGALFYPAFYKYDILRLTKTFKNNLESLLENGKKLGGNLCTEGDGAIELRVFPKAFIKIIYWLGDDEFPASANILFNRSIVDVMHIESVIGLGGLISNALCSMITGDKNNA